MSDDDFDIEIIDDAALGEIDAIESAYATGSALPPRSLVNKPGLMQRDLFGGVVAPPAQKPPPKAGPSRTTTSGSAGSAGGAAGETRAKVRLSKTWDPASFARHGWSKKNAAVAKARAKGKSGKGKQRAYASDEDPWDEEDVFDDDDEDSGGEEFFVDTTYDPSAPILPIKWPPDEQAAKTFIYPVQADKPLRVYQYNIVQRCLYENTLVSLPTGLGKTFIAAVVMLNFYRWYPRGKVLFLAPTRPLVTQQIKACHYIAGIPQSDCVELTGGTLPKLRTVGWATKRVIYSTPQTVERDLAKGRLDPRDVTCIVVDEAHRASGDYAYCGVIRYMMCRNPHFRVLALTATPGSRGDAVQEVIDNLHIGRIEVRADDSLDIRQYIHKKSFDLVVLPLGPQLSALRDKWAELMKQYINPLYAARLLWSNDPVMLAPFAVQQAYVKINGLPGGKRANGKFFPMIKTLAMMARAMEYLVIQSVTSFESNLKDIEAAGSKNLINSAGFREVVRETAGLRNRVGYVGHPKMEKLRSMCLDHFKSAQNERDEFTGEKRETRVMIFCNFRAVVEEIVACLNTQRPLIKATPFVGQASAKGVKGKSQKEQLETIKKFKAGVYNVLVATSIGEEGLDIGEIDLIICYEANKSPIRMLQRVGRTGRARDGHIIVLMAEGREEKNWDKANDAYAEVQNALTSNKIFDLYVDGERMLPDHIKPACEQVQIKAQPLDIEKMTMKGQTRLERKALTESKKEKRKVDIHANAPDDAFLGFRTAGQMAAAKKEKPLPPSQVLRNRKAAALLTLEEESYLRSRWQHDSSGKSVSPRIFDLEDLPFERGLSGGAHRIPRHGERHLDLLTAMRAAEQLADSKTTALDAWHDKHSKAFNPKLVQVFRAEDRQGLPPRHKRLRRPPPVVEDEPPASFPVMTGFPAAPSSSMFGTADQQSGRPLFRQPSAQEIDPLAAELFSSPHRRNKRVSVSPVPTPSPPAKRDSRSTPPHVSSPVRHAKPPSRPASRASQHTKTLDLSNLDSDDEPLVPQPKKGAPPPQEPAAPANTSFSIDLDDDGDLVMSDSELLAGAVIRGPSKSTSPPKPALAKPNGIVLAGPSKATGSAIIIEDSDDEPLVAAPARPARTVSAPILPAPQPVRPAAAASSAFRPFVPPRPSLSQPAATTAKPASPPAAAPAPGAAPSSSTSFDAGDDFSILEIAEDELDACIAQAQAKAQQPQPIRADVDRDRQEMPPPPVARHVVAGPSTAKAAFRPAGSSPAVPAGGARAVPMRRLAVPDSSSSPVLAKKRLGPPRRDVEVVVEITQRERPREKKGKAKLKRGKEAREDAAQGEDEDEHVRAKKRRKGVVEDDEEEENGEDARRKKKSKRKDKGKRKAREEEQESEEEEGDDAERRRKKAKKKEILMHKQASRFGIFDIEAVNSSASGTEASSEGYSSENSIDREFVAATSSDVHSDDDAQQQFYRDSLATQAPPGFGTPVLFGNRAARWQERMGRGLKPIPVTPGSQEEFEREDWSYDSFVVHDDEEIEYETSSPGAPTR
ncbi:ATP-dependent DNA helicase mph1 [Rhodotorula toruloides]|nr:ATP-dependent DNA helicase mph1 [Rhodotorula toruloides]